MELRAGQVAVVTGAGSGIGLAMAERFARRGLDVVLADIQDDALAEAASRLGSLGVQVLAVRTDVSKEDEVQALALATMERFGAVHVVCNNAGVAARADPWFGPLSSWQWVLGVNLWGVVHGVRAFLPHLAAQPASHIVNTASIAGLMPGFGPSYDASKHAVVALTEDLFRSLQLVGLPIGVSVLCPGWVRTGIMDSERNWPTEYGERPEAAPASAVTERFVRSAIDEGMTPAAVADVVADGIEANRFWLFPHPDFVELVVRRWETIAEGIDPQAPPQVPGMPPNAEVEAEVRRALGMA